MLPEDFTLDLTRTNQRNTIAELGGTRANMFNVPWRQISRIPGYNVREETDPGYPQHVAWLRKSIFANGYDATHPMIGFTGLKDAVPAIWLTDGYSRHEAVAGAADDGRDVESVTMIVLPNEATAREVMIALATGNNGRQLTPLGLAIVVERLQRQGLAVKEIAHHLAIEPRYVSDLRMLIKAPEDVRRQVADGAIAATLAIQMLREGAERASERIAAAGAIAKAAGKTKVTAKHVKAAEAPLLRSPEPLTTDIRPYILAPHCVVGTRVQVHSEARGPSGMRMKCCGRIGTVVALGEKGRISVKFDDGSSHGALTNADVVYAPDEPTEAEALPPLEIRTGDLLQNGDAATPLEKPSTDPGPVTTTRPALPPTPAERMEWLALFFASRDHACVDSYGGAVFVSCTPAVGEPGNIAEGDTIDQAINNAMAKIPYATLAEHARPK